MPQVVFNPFTSQLQFDRYWGGVDDLITQSGDAVVTQGAEPVSLARIPRLVRLLMDSVR